MAEVTIINRTINIPPDIIVIQGDCNSTIITFQMADRYYDGIDLSNKIIKVAYKNVYNQSKESDAVIKTVGENSFTFDWTMPSEVAVKAGTVTIGIIIKNSTNTYVWKTKPKTFSVEQSFTVYNNAIPLDYSTTEAFYATYDDNRIVEVSDTNEPIYIQGREILMTLRDNIVVQGDNKSQLLTFFMDRFYNNVDRSSKKICVPFINAAGHGDRGQVVNKVINDTTITFGWLLDSKVTEKQGNIQFKIEIIGYDENNNFTCWQSLQSQFQVEEGLNVDDTMVEPTPSWIQEWELTENEIIARENQREIDFRARYDAIELEYKTKSSVFTASSNNVSNIVHNLYYNPIYDELEVTYKGIKLTKDENYVDNADNLSIKLTEWEIHYGEKVYFRCYRNVNKV